MKYIITDNFFTPIYNINGVFIQKIHSFRIRNRSLKSNKINLIKKYWPYLGINFTHRLINLKKIFHYSNNPILLEIGFGNGESLINTYFKYPNYNIIGIDVYISGIYKLIYQMNLLKKNFCKRMKIISHDVVEVLQYMFSDNSINIIQIFFPDPWPKIRHHKRRMLNKYFIKLLVKKLQPNGIIHIMTDCILYANSILNILNNIKYVTNLSDYFQKKLLYNFKINTFFEKQAYIQNKQIINLIFRCIK